MAPKDKNSLEYKRLRQVNNIDDTNADYTYVGYEHPDGEWMIMLIDKTSGMVFTYATSKLNPSIPNDNYDTAWAARAELVYDVTKNAF